MSKAGGLGLSLVLAAPCGLLFWLAMPPIGLWPLSIVGCALLTAALARSRTAAQAVGLAALAKATYLPTCYSYLGSVAPEVMLLYSWNQVLVWTFFGVAFHVIRRSRGTVAAVSAVPFLWVLFDWLTLRFHFLPSELVNWGGVFGHTPLRSLAPYVGVYGITLLAAAAGVAPVLVLLLRSGKKKPPRDRLRPAYAAAAWIAFAAAIGLCAHPGGRSAHKDTRAGLRIATVGLGPSWEKTVRAWDMPAFWTPPGRGIFKDFVRLRLERMARDIPAPPPDLIIMPEDAIDVFFRDDRSQEAFSRWGFENNGALIETYQDFARKSGSAVIVGLTTFRQGVPRNTVLFIDRDGSLADRYEKVHLTVGSEYWPLASVLFPYWKHLGSNFIPFDKQYAAGTEPSRLFKFGGFSFGAPVCLEAQIPRRVLGWRRAGAEFLTVLTNSAWFENSPRIYNRQTLGLARLLSAAYGVPIFLAGKSSYYGYVDPSGTVSVRPGFDAAPASGVAVHEVTASSRQTAVTRLGEYSVPASVIGLMLVSLTGSVRPPRLKDDLI